MSKGFSLNGLVFNVNEPWVFRIIQEEPEGMLVVRKENLDKLRQELTQNIINSSFVEDEGDMNEAKEIIDRLFGVTP